MGFCACSGWHLAECDCRAGPPSSSEGSPVNDSGAFHSFLSLSFFFLSASFPLALPFAAGELEASPLVSSLGASSCLGAICFFTSCLDSPSLSAIACLGDSC